MDDSLMNPMKTGLMFVPLGPAVSRGSSPRARRHGGVAEFEIATEVPVQAPPFMPMARFRAMLRRSLKRIRPAPQEHVAYPV